MMAREKVNLIVILRFLVGSVFVFSSIAKLANEAEFQQDLNQLMSLSSSLVSVMGYLVPLVELVLGALLISGVFLKLAALSASGLLLLFLVTFLPLAGTSTKCGCFGGISTGESIGFGFFLRDILLFGAAFFIYGRLNRDNTSGIQRRQALKE